MRVLHNVVYRNRPKHTICKITNEVINNNLFEIIEKTCDSKPMAKREPVYLTHSPTTVLTTIIIILISFRNEKYVSKSVEYRYPQGFIG